MQKSKNILNTIYISERMKEYLCSISRCALTTIIAPMGYGKTTAINWYLARQIKSENAVIVRINIYSDNLSIFWKSVQNAFAFSGLDMLKDYACPDDNGSAALLMDELCYDLAGSTPYYVFFDDAHLLENEHFASFLSTLANRLPENVHMIVASRARFLKGNEILRLGGKLHQIGIEQLKLNELELPVYAHCCGIKLNNSQMEALLRSCEGWFSAIYLNLRSLAEKGVLLDRNSDIYGMFTSALIDPLQETEQEFLAVMGLVDEFTAEMAYFITGNPDVDRILSVLTNQNAFVSRLSDGVSFRFHHMMKECSERIFARLNNQKREEYWNRYGTWYEDHKQYLHALHAYEKCGNYDVALRVIEKDAGILLTAIKVTELLEFLEDCPVEVLKEHPLAILVFMRRMFTWRQIGKMMELKALLMAAVREHPDMSQEERGNLLGECDVIMSYLMYNDITKMSQLHRSASRQMSRPAVTLRAGGSWTFGSPSVLMMYYRAPGELAKELEEMNDCMPHYYKITCGHGQGAELVMNAEASLAHGDFDEAAIMLERARTRIAECGHENMTLCCDLLELRMTLCGHMKMAYDFEEKRKKMLKTHDMTLINIFESISAYYYALLGNTEQIPDVFRNHELSSNNYFAPGKPMMEMIENQVYLAQGEYLKVIGRSERLLGMCEDLHYALVAIHIRLQTAAAYEMIGKRAEAKALMTEIFQAAIPDNMLIPFVENYRYLAPLIDGLSWKEADAFAEQAAALGKAYEKCCASMNRERLRPAAVSKLTDRELELAYLIAARMSNKEIAEKLFLSEGTIKQYSSQIYSKLNLEGDARTKRKRLIGLLRNKT